MNVFYWFLAGVSITGVLLNIHGRRICFVLWAYTAMAWAIADMEHDLPQQAAVQAMYFVLALYGLWRWSRKPAPFATSPPARARRP